MTILYVRDGDQFREAATKDVLERANTLIARRFRSGAPILSTPSRTREFLRLKLGALEHEIFAVLFLDNRHRLIEYVELFRGTIDGASCHPREIVNEALARNAAALILVHFVTGHRMGVMCPYRLCGATRRVEVFTGKRSSVGAHNDERRWRNRRLGN